MTRSVALLGALAMAAALRPIPASARDQAQAAVEPASRMTIEVDWAVPPAPAPAPSVPAASPRPGAVELAVGGGRVVDAMATSPDAPAPRALADGSWSLGTASRGRVRARVDAPIGGSLTIRAGGQEAIIPVASVLEGPQRASPGAGVEIGVLRPAWDSIRVELGPEAGDGTAAPGSTVPVRVGFDVRTPEGGDVALRATAELRPARGGEPAWRQDWQEVVAANVPSSSIAPPKQTTLNIAAPAVEGTYVLEVRARWEPLAGQAGPRLGRLAARRRNARESNSATRRMTLAVLPTPSRAASPPLPSRTDGAGVQVDAIDMGRAWGHRPSASGRSSTSGSGRMSWPVPEAALVEPAFRDRVRGWINRGGPEPATLAPADASGLAWTAIGLRVPHPDRPHRLTLSVAGGHPSSLGVALMASSGLEGAGARVVLDACASGAPILEGGPPASFSWPVWPDDDDPILVLVNRDPRSPVVLGSVTLEEMPDLPPASMPRGPGRSLGLHLVGPRDLDRFGGTASVDGGRVDPVARARNLATYLAHCGASTVVLPDGLADRARRRGLDGQSDEDATGPDRLDVLLRVLARRGVSAWVDVPFDGLLPGLPAPDSPEAAAEGLARVDRRGRPEGSAYQPLHPRVREAMARKVAEAVAPRKTHANLAGALVRLGPGSTLPGGPDSGLDDASFGRFVASSFDPGLAARVPGRGAAEPGRFEARARFVEGSGRLPWLSWRSAEVAGVYAGLAEAARKSAPGSLLAVSTPGLEPGPAGDEARRVDQAGLGPAQAWRGVGFDLAAWPTNDGAPIVLRAAGLSTDDLAHDLATSHELDEPVAAHPGRGALIGVEPADAGHAAGPRLSAIPMADGPAGDEAMGHAVAALDATRVIVAASSAVGQEERLRRFARPFASLPAAPPGPPSPRLPSGAVARAFRSEADTVLALANDTPYPILLEAEIAAPTTATVDDLGRGLRLAPQRGPGGIRLVLDLPPFGIAAARVGAPDARIASARPHPDPVALEGMKTQYDDLSARLNRLQGGNAAPERGPGPANAGFEPDTVQLAASRPAPVVPGWDVAPGAPGAGGAGASIEVDRDRPRSGRGSLRIDATGAGAAAISDPFRPAGRSALTVRSWIRTDRPEARVRVRIDGQAGGRPYATQAEVVARGDWAEATLHAAQLPPGGLDSARLRFELLGPGRLWVDDVSVTGDAPTESERLNARRDLMAALLAYDEKRYADFARKAGSHWARHLAPDAPAPAIAEHPAPIRTGNASDLPSGRQLR